MRTLRTLIAVSAISLALYGPTRIHAHTSLIEPKSREGGKQVFEDVGNKIGCGKPGPGPVNEVKAGADLSVKYYRNNHLGGFVRWAIIKKGEQETRENFDKNAFHYTCQESGPNCKPADPSRPFALYDNQHDGTPVFSIICGETIPVPNWLEDGDYVLQYTNYGTGHSDGQAGKATPIYRSCADLKISGGSTSNKKPSCPTFKGGDRATAGEKKSPDQCMFYHSNEIPNDQFKTDNAEEIKANYKFGKPAEVEKCGGGGGAGTVAPAGATATNASTNANPSKRVLLRD